MMITINDILNYLNSLYPNARCELNYTTDYSFLIAVVLSAQATDKSVNLVTPILFDKYDSLEKLASANVEDIKDIIKTIGFFENKAGYVIEIAKDLINKFNSKVPSDLDDLLSLKGVGIKTANVVRIELFNIPSIPVDTHVSRVSKRLGLVNFTDNVNVIEQKLEKLVDKSMWIRAHHLFIFFGRYFCKAISPNCKNCKLCAICKEKFKNLN